MSRLIGKTAAITGAARGIGAEYAKKLASEGANVIVTDILDPAEVVAEINAAEGGSAVGMIVDVTSDDDLNAMVAKLKRIWCAQHRRQQRGSVCKLGTETVFPDR